MTRASRHLRPLVLWILAVWITGPALCAAEDLSAVLDGWHSDFGEALSESRATGKHIYVAFLGSDWSVASRRWIREILASEDFNYFSRENLVLLSADFERRPKETKERLARQQSLVIHFDVKTYPTLILLAPDGAEVLRHGLLEHVDASQYTDSLRALIPSTATVTRDSGAVTSHSDPPDENG